MRASVILEMMEGVAWMEVRTATERGNAVVLMHLHKALCEFARARACEAVERALKAAPRNGALIGLTA